MKSKLWALAAVVVLLLATVGGVAFATYDSHITPWGYYIDPVTPGEPWWTITWYTDYDTEPPDPPFDGVGFYITGNYGVMCGYIGTENQTCPDDMYNDMQEISDIYCVTGEIDENGFPGIVMCSVYYYGDRWDDVFYYGNVCHSQVAYQGPPPNYESDILFYLSGDCVDWSR